MCGIVGYIGKNSKQNIINCLENLLNRGYDSIGICSGVDDFYIEKFISDNTSSAFSKLSNEKNDCNIGIGHTRWATHGKINIENCHPHVSNDGNVCIVHNGIIENYKEIKFFLMDKGFKFSSDTDTEIICNLISYYYKENNILLSIKKTIERMEGSWGLVIIIKGDNKLYFTKKQNPILLGVTENKENAIITSEKSGFNKMIKEYTVIDDFDICYIEKINEEIVFFSVKSLNETKQQLTNNFIIDNSLFSKSDKIYKKLMNNCSIENNIGYYKFWTLKEIEEQKYSSKRSLNINNIQQLQINQNIFRNIDNIILLGCGTSYNAGHFVHHFFKKNTTFNTVQIIDGADFCNHDIPKYGKTCCIFISQSGETLDLIRCLDTCKKNNIVTISILNVEGSILSRETDCVCYTNSGKEVGVASTKSFTGQIIVLLLVHLWFKGDSDILNSLRNIYLDIETTLNNSREIMKVWSSQLKDKKHIFILGKDECYSISREASLKIKEISYIHAESYSSSSLKHGPFGLLEKGFPVILIDIGDYNRKKIDNVYNEIKSREAIIFTITDDINSTKNNSFFINTKSKLNNILSIIPLQYLSFYLSIDNQLNPDYPRNLAKVVTVE